METFDIETVEGRMSAFAEFLGRYPTLDPSGELRGLVERAKLLGSAEVEAALIRKYRDVIRPQKELVAIAWNALESAQKRAHADAKERHRRLGSTFDEDKLAFNWREGARALGLSQNLAGSIDAAQQTEAPLARAPTRGRHRARARAPPRHVRRVHPGQEAARNAG